MPRLYVQNLTDKQSRIAIEPWAQLIVLAPEEMSYIEYDEPAEIGFYIDADGGGVDIISDRIKFENNGQQETFTWPDSFK